MKYMGSKARVFGKISEIILAEKNDSTFYVEPFCGGCNSLDKVDGRRIASDANYHLIAMWELLLSGWVPRIYSKDEYISARNGSVSFSDGEVGWMAFNCSYSGKFWGGFAGEVKTKIGTIRNYQEEAIKNVMSQVQKLQGVDFFHCDYSELHIPDGSIVYCDPPYRGTTGYSGGFDHDAFWDWCRDLSTRCKVFISEYNAPDDFKCVWSHTVKSSLSANGVAGGNKESVEKLFIHG